MNKLFNSGLLIIFLGAAGVTAYASDSSITMGNLTSVVPNRAYDSARNPALLGMPGEGALLGLGLRAGSLIHDDVTLSDREFHGSFNYESEYSGSITLGYAWRSGNLSYGLAFYSNTEDDQIRRSRTSVSASTEATIPGPIDVNLIYKQVETSLEFNPTFNFALAYSVGGGAYMGVQTIIGITHKTVDQSFSMKVYDLSHVYIGSSDQDFIRTYYRLTAEAGLGYIQAFENGHTGIMIRSGVLSFEYISGDLETVSTFPVPPDDSMSVSSFPRYSIGPMIVAGFYKRVMSSLGCAFEVAYRFPVSYTGSDLQIKDDALSEKSIVVANEERFEFKAGGEYTLSPDMAVSAGIMYYLGGKSISNTETDDKSRETEKQEFSLFAVTGGINYRMDERTRVNAGVAVIKAGIEIDRFLEMNFIRMDILAGVTLGL